MAREEAPAPNGPETFQQLKALLGRLPTVDELSRELDAAPLRRRPGLRFTIVGVTGLLLLAIPFFVGQLPGLEDVASPDAPVPTRPPVPDIETALALPPLPVVMAPPLPPIEEAPARRPVPAREKARAVTRRRVIATTPRPAPNPPAPQRVEDAAIQQRVLPTASASARRTITGRVRINIRVSVDSSGTVTTASSLSPDASRYFNGLALKAARQWKFAPAASDRADGAREWVLRFEFGREDTAAALAAQ